MQNNPRWAAALETTLKNVLAIAVAAWLAMPAAFAEDKAADVTDMQALRTAVKTDKRAFVASTMDLTPAEAKKFWPIYDQYQREIDLTSRQKVLAIQDLLFREKPMTNLAAKSIVSEAIAIDEAELKARRSLRNKVMRALPALKAARYLQLEEKIQAVRDYDIAATVPLIR